MVGCYSGTNGWAGVPLISTAARRPRKFPPTVPNVPVNHYQPVNSKADFDENAMSRLALHAHGAPLILANNRYRSNSNKTSGHINKPKQVPSRDDHSHHQIKLSQNMVNQQFSAAVVSHPNDTHSVASDESSPGTTNSSSSSTSSDTCLPRIIKPRKRRKKDRKPNVQNITPITGTVTTTPSSTTSTSTDSLAVGLGPGQLATNHTLILDETTRDFLNEIALIANAGGHFDFKIELNRAKDVGVIGSNRSNSFRSEWRSSPHSLDQPSDKRQLPHQPAQQEFGSGSSRKGSFSDSGDSGCDLLSGLTFCSEDILGSVNRELFMTPVDASKEFQFPTTVPGGGGGSGASVVNNNSISASVACPGDNGDNSELILISELTKKLNEGLDLGMSGSSDGGSGSSSSVFSDGGVFSGNSGSTEGSPNCAAAAAAAVAADMFVNFDTISRNTLFSVNNISKLSNLLFDDGLTAPGLVMGSGQAAHNVNHGSIGNGISAVSYNLNKNIPNLQPPPPPLSTSANSSSSLFSDHQQFMFGVPDGDRNCDRGVLNCFDMVWSNNVADPAGWWWRKNRDTHTTHYRAKHSTYRLLATPAPATGGLCGLQNQTQVARLIVYLSVLFARPLARASYHTTDKELPCVCFGSYCCGGELVEAGIRLGHC
ncbi:hypothetical protein RP20_CCG022777 [Aedes albopictus]|nr:hypothetical protein RP20_CCG022777 [Aedes albopictus]